MQTPAEEYLINKVVDLLKIKRQQGGTIALLNVGAGKSTVLEESIADGFGSGFVCDRLDIVDCSARHPSVGRCYIASVESMPEIETAKYDIAFANYVFEHVSNLKAAARELDRVLKPGGYFVVSLPNPIAPEFILSRLTPLRFHQMIKGRAEGIRVYETHYAYRSIREFVSIFERYFSVVEIRQWPHTFGYLYRFPVANIVSKLYDKVVAFFRIKFLMGNVCIVFKKPTSSSSFDQRYITSNGSG